MEGPPFCLREVFQVPSQVLLPPLNIHLPIGLLLCEVPGHGTHIIMLANKCLYLLLTHFLVRVCVCMYVCIFETGSLYVVSLIVSKLTI